jgi:hypothetical protein
VGLDDMPCNGENRYTSLYEFKGPPPGARMTRPLKLHSLKKGQGYSPDCNGFVMVLSAFSCILAHLYCSCEQSPADCADYCKSLIISRLSRFSAGALARNRTWICGFDGQVCGHAAGGAAGRAGDAAAHFPGCACAPDEGHEVGGDL